MERLSDYDYVLPEDRIAQTPLADRAASKLLVVPRDGSAFQHRTFRDVVDLLEPGDLLVMNDTRVSAVRLIGHRPTGGATELLLLREVAEDTWEALARPGKRLGVGATAEFDGGLVATVRQVLPDGRRHVHLTAPGGVAAALAAVGKVPLPPYIRVSLEDKERYQTVYAATAGSAAAPTAGLHFTPEVLGALHAKGVKTATVTLDVGLDTFRPIHEEDPTRHAIHGERCAVPAATAEAVANCRGRVIAVGTTSVRTLETFAEGPRRLRVGSQESRLYITPGFDWKIVDGMFTNFHMPRTTMLLMISAMAGRDRIMTAYAEALTHDYRFLSFGDSMLIL